MHFYIDESGQTGTNLFDPSQPRLYYGTLSCEHDLDSVAKMAVMQMKKIVGEYRLHATDLGVEKVVKLIPALMLIQDRVDPILDIYTVEKQDHAIISFFDQVFDSGLNEAVPATSYWTPLRYLLLLKVSYLFDEQTQALAWEARIQKDDVEATRKLVDVCAILNSRIKYLPDTRSQELIGDALYWAMKNPSEICYNCASDEDILDIAPNMIGFQFVLAGISSRISDASHITRVIVDKQSQFNKAQSSLAKHYSKMRGLDPFFGVGMPTMNFKNMPTAPLEFRSSRRSPGLELADIYLWVLKRYMEGEYLPAQFDPLIESQLGRAVTNQLSLTAIEQRWKRFYAELPEPTEEEMRRGQELHDLLENRRREAINRSL